MSVWDRWKVWAVVNAAVGVAAVACGSETGTPEATTETVGTSSQALVGLNGRVAVTFKTLRLAGGVEPNQGTYYAFASFRPAGDTSVPPSSPPLDSNIWECPTPPSNRLGLPPYLGANREVFGSWLRNGQHFAGGYYCDDATPGTITAELNPNRTRSVDGTAKFPFDFAETVNDIKLDLLFKEGVLGGTGSLSQNMAFSLALHLDQPAGATFATPTLAVSSSGALNQIQLGTFQAPCTSDACKRHQSLDACAQPFLDGHQLCFGVEVCQKNVGSTGDATCDGVDDDCDGAIDEDVVPGGVVDDCNGQNDDCDDKTDEDFVPKISPTFCPACLGLPSFNTSCTSGAEVDPCKDICAVPPTVPGGWDQHAFGYDFDVANDTLCFTQGLKDANEYGIVCTSAITSPGVGGSMLQPVPVAADFDKSGPYVRLSLDPHGRIWASSLKGIYTTTESATLTKVAPNPPGCSTGVDQLELVGPADRMFYGPTSLLTAICKNGLFHLDLTAAGGPAWVNDNLPSLSFGASPSRAFDLFFGAKATNPITNLSEDYGWRSPASNLTQYSVLDRLGTGQQNGRVGGVFGAFHYQTIEGEVCPGCAPGSNVMNHGDLVQWNGTKYVEMSDLTRTQPRDPNTGAYPPVTAIFSCYAAAVGSCDGPNDGKIRKIQEGGGVGVGGPSLPGRTDLMWLIQDSARIYSYTLAAIPASFSGGLSGNDSIPVTAALSRIAGQSPVAACHDVSRTAGPTCQVNVTAGDVNSGSSDPNGNPLQLTLNAPGLFPVGTTPVALTVSDGSTSDTCQANVIVTDTIAPTVTAPANLSATVCAAGNPVSVGVGKATDNCKPTLPVTGSVVSKNGTALATPLPVTNGTVTLSPGVYRIDWTATDGTTSVTQPQTVTLTGETLPPVLTLPANVSLTTCAAANTVTTGTATATDACPVTVSGAITSVNGTTLTTPIPVSAGQAPLAVGNYTVKWTASDGANTSQGTQSVNVAPRIEAKNGFTVADRARVRLASGAGAAVLNAGSIATTVGSGAQAGDILSVGSVTLVGSASAGNITSQAGISVPGTATAGVQKPFQTVLLPPLAALPTFPNPTGTAITVDSGKSRTLTPGSFFATTVNSGGTLVLGAGDYFFDSLTIQSNAKVRVTATTRIFVRNTFTLRSSFTLANGSIQAIYLGLAATGTITLEAVFNGTLLAPNAQVTFGTSPNLTYTGAFFARNIELRPDTTLVCTP